MKWLAVCTAVLFIACASLGGTGGGSATGEGLSLDEAVEQSAVAVAEKLPAKTRVAIVAFEADHEHLAGYIMDELTGEMVNGSLEVADRNNLPYVLKELNLQTSGLVDDASAASVGKFLGAEYVITGQLVNTGGAYRYRVNAIKVETAQHEVSERHTVRNDRVTKNLVAALGKGKPVVRVAAYGVAASTEVGSTAPSTAGAFLDRGIMFAMRGDYEMAIEDFTEAIALKPDLYSAYMLRGQALYASVSEGFILKEKFFMVGFNTKSVTGEQQTVYDRAIADLNEAIKLAPNETIAYNNRGLIHYSKGNSDRAIADFNQAIQLDSNNADVKNNLELARRRGR
jgi:tetratricopeptide (TPR) repeat protein